jgi:hypothetical protein
MRLLLLSVGDRESRHSWSGSTKSLVDHLRRSGHSVDCRDVDLQRFARWRTALLTVTLDQRRCWVRYQFGSRGFTERSRRAQKAVDDAALDLDANLEIGATFSLTAPEGVPLALDCDSNVELAAKAQSAKRRRREGSRLCHDRTSQLAVVPYREQPRPFFEVRSLPLYIHSLASADPLL